MTTDRYTFQQPYREALQAAWNTRGDGDHRGVFWFGAPGTGKTHVGEDFCRWACAQHVKIPRGDMPPSWRRVTAFSANALELVAEAQAAIGRNKAARSSWDMIQQIKASDVAMFDDLGREREDFGQSLMFTLLDTALASNCFVIVTANRDAKALAEYYRGDAGLRSRLSALLQQEWPADLPNLRKPAPKPQGYEARERKDLA
jgi:DNA replication protein DnaC